MLSKLWVACVIARRSTRAAAVGIACDMLRASSSTEHVPRRSSTRHDAGRRGTGPGGGGLRSTPPGAARTATSPPRSGRPGCATVDLAVEHAAAPRRAGRSSARKDSSTTRSAAASWSTLGGFRVHRLGFEAMRITASASGACRRTGRGAADAAAGDGGIDFIDRRQRRLFQSDALGEALARIRRGTAIATKGGLVRHGPTMRRGMPSTQAARAHEHAPASGGRVGLWQVPPARPRGPVEEVYDAMASMQRDGIVRHLGLPT